MQTTNDLDQNLDSEGEFDFNDESPPHFMMDPQWSLRLKGLIRSDGHVTTEEEKKYFLAIVKNFKRNMRPGFANVRFHDMAIHWNTAVSRAILTNEPIIVNDPLLQFSDHNFTFKTRYQLKQYGDFLDQQYERQQRAGSDANSRAARWRRHNDLQNPEPAHPLPPPAEPNALPQHASFLNGQSHFQIIAPQQIPTASNFSTSTSFILTNDHEQSIPDAIICTRNAIACIECGVHRHRSSSACIIYRYYQYSINNTNDDFTVQIIRRRNESGIKAAERTWQNMSPEQKQALINLFS
jgi:hypothetical protein